MALVKPFLYKIPSFDASDLLSTTFTFGSTNSSSETNILKVEVNLYDNASGKLIYTSNETPVMESTSTDILQTYTFVITNTTGETIDIYNGNTYNMTVRTSLSSTPTDDDWSSASNGMIFSCYSTPSLTFTNIPDNKVITQSTFKVLMEYSQEENEQLNYYQVFLDAKPVSDSSTTVTVASGEISYDSLYQCTFSNLHNTYNYDDESLYHTYQFRVVGSTIGGTTFTDTSDEFEVDILEVYNSTLVKLTNSQEGYIEISSEISNIEGVASPASLTTDEYTELDLTTEGYNVTWDEGLSIGNSEYTIELWGRDFQANSEISTMTNDNGNTSIRLRWNVDTTTNEAYIGMYVTTDGNINLYYIESNKITTPSSDEYIYIGINKGYAFCNINIINKGTTI